MKLFGFERDVGYLHTVFAQQRFPLLNSVALAGRGVVDTRNYGKKTHDIF